MRDLPRRRTRFFHGLGSPTRSSTFIARVHYSCTSVYLISWTVYLRILRTRLYDVMVGCWFAGQGKKGDCVGKKVNGGPVIQLALLLSYVVHNQLEIVNTISTVYGALWLHYIMQQETVQVLLDPPLPSAFPLLHFREGEEGLAARHGLTSQGTLYTQGFQICSSKQQQGFHRSLICTMK